jgi:hypothetical protein
MVASSLAVQEEVPKASARARARAITRLGLQVFMLHVNARDDAPCKNIADTADTPERAIDTADSI